MLQLLKFIFATLLLWSATSAFLWLTLPKNFAALGFVHCATCFTYGVVAYCLGRRSVL